MKPVRHWLRENRSTLILLAIVGTAYLALRSSPTLIGTGQIEARLAQGQPTVVEFYSNL